MPSNYTRRISLYINGKEVKNEIASIKAEMNKLVSQQARMTIGSKEYVAAGKQIKQLKGIIAEHNEQLKVTAGGWAGLKKAADGFNRYFAMFTAGIAAVGGFVISMKNMITGNAELSDSLADVAKTTGLTTTEVKELYSALGKIDTRTSRKELLDLAYVAGKLGYSSQADILGFVKAADQIGVALSKDLGGNVEEAVTSLGKLTDLFKTKDQYGIEDALLKTGSAINALGAAGTANEGYIVDFTKRLGGIAPQAGLSIQQVMGLGATLDQLGQQTETSSTAITQLLTKMFKNPAEFAAIAGVNVDKFSKILKKDANEALLLFLDGLQKNKGGLSELAAKFGDLGVDGSRAITVIGALANNTDMLRTSQELANTEFEKGTSLTNEFNLKNENLAGNLDRIGKAIRSAFVNSGVNDALASIVKKIADWFEIPLSKKLDDERIKVNMLASEMLDANTPIETRNKLYKELKSIAPDVVEGIDAENIALDKLRINLEKYNEQLINKIIIQKQQEVIDKANEKVAENREDRLKQEAEVRERLMKLYTEAQSHDKAAAAQINKINTDPTLTLLQKAEAVNKFIFDYQKKNNLVLATPGSLVGKINVLKIYAEEEAAAQLQVNKALEAKKQLYKDLKIVSDEAVGKANGTKTDGTVTGNDGGNGVGVGGGGGIEVLTDAFQELEKKIKELDTQINNAIANGNSPLVEKLTIEKNAALLLLDTYNQVKKAYEAGWDMDQDDLTDLGKIVAKSSGLVVSDKPGGGREMEERKFNDDFSGPSQQVQDEEEAAAELRDQIADQVLDSAKVLNDSIFAIVKNRQQAELDLALSNIEKKRKAELDNKNLSEREIAAINEKYDKQAAALKLKQFKKDQNAAATMALVNGALAITKTFAAYGFTPAGWIAAAGQALATLAEITVIKSAKPPEYYEGGFTAQASSNMKPVGVVHANEYVIPADMVQNPEVRPIIDGLEVARQSRNMSRLNMGAIMKAMINSGGFANGGFTSSQPDQPGNSDINELITQNKLLYSMLIQKLSEPLEAKVAIRGRYGINEKLAEDQQTRKTAYL